MTEEDEKTKLEQAIAALESQRGILGNAVVETALGPLREKLEALAARPDPEQRKLVTVLFADLVGFTAMSERLDPEDVRQIQQAYFAEITRPVMERRGNVEKYIGDALLAVFGLVQAQEDDPDQAVLAALGMQTALADLNQSLESKTGVKLEQPLQMRVGVNTGLVVVGMRSEGDFVVTGDTVNLASRLQNAAPPGGVLIANDTYRHVRGAFDLQPLEPLTVKGKHDSVQVYRVMAAKPRSFRTRRRGVEGIATRMIGREPELKTLQNAYLAMIEDGERQMVTIVGEPGLGKSRLLYEFENWVDLLPEKVMLFRGRARQETRMLPHSLLRDIFSFRFGVQDDDPIAVVRQKIEKGMSDFRMPGVRSEMAERAHFVGELLGYDFSASPYIQPVIGDPQQIRDRGRAYLIDYIKAAAKQAPVLILLEDLHWADDSSLDTISRLALALQASPALLVAATRPSLFERREHWMEGREFHVRIDLHPLSKRDSRHMIEEVLQKVEDIPQFLPELLISNAEGNPFYIEELVKMLVEDGVIVKGDTWKVQAERLRQTQVPATLTGVLQARLDSLPKSERLVLQQASVVGRIFWDKIVVFFNQSGAIRLENQLVEDGLTALREKEMIYQRETSAFAEAGEYIFNNAILREVTYGSVLKQVRRIYHAMVAEWLQTQAAGRSGELTGLIADHLEHAGKTTHALAYWRKAAQEAETSYANREAINYYTHALALVPENDLETSCDVLLKREDLYNKIGDSSARAADLNILTEIRDALTAAGKASEGVLCAEITYRLALFILTQGNFAKAEVEAQKAVDLARAAEVPGVVVKAYLVWSAILYRQGDYPAGKAKAEEALQFARQIEDYKGQSQALNTMGVLAMEQVELETAKGYLQESLQLSIKLADRRLECITRANLAMLAGNMGDFSTAHDQYLEVINRYREIGDRSGEGNALGNLGWLMGMLGDYAAAYAYAETNRKIFQEVEDPLNETVGLINLSSFARLQGNLQLATQHAEQALEQAHRIALSNWEAWALTVLGHAHFEEDQYTKAWHDYQRALEIRNRLAQPYLAMEPMAGLLRIALVEENLPGARELIRQILDYLDHGGTLEGADEPMRVYLTCFQALEDLQDPRAGEILDIALKRLHQQADRIVGEESRRSYLENIPWHREILEASKRQVGAE